jgi:hypothetical protein
MSAISSNAPVLLNVGCSDCLHSRYCDCLRVQDGATSAQEEYVHPVSRDILRYRPIDTSMGIADGSDLLREDGTRGSEDDGHVHPKFFRERLG